jgi:hypothetical protein
VYGCFAGSGCALGLAHDLPNRQLVAGWGSLPPTPGWWQRPYASPLSAIQRCATALARRIDTCASRAVQRGLAVGPKALSIDHNRHCSPVAGHKNLQALSNCLTHPRLLLGCFFPVLPLHFLGSHNKLDGPGQAGVCFHLINLPWLRAWALAGHRRQQASLGHMFGAYVCGWIYWSSAVHSSVVQLLTHH